MIKNIRDILSTMRLVYQPIVDNKEVVKKVEVLLRWDTSIHPTIINPEMLVAWAEEDPQAIKLVDKSVLNALVACYSNWKFKSDTNGMEKIKFSINLSPHSIAYDESFVRKFEDVAEIIPPELLEIELLETRFTSAMEDKLHSNLRLLSQMGISVALDDFGNGFGCINKMSWMAFDNVKLDGKLTKKINTCKEADFMIGSLIKLARDIGADITAEKIESREQFLKLCEMGCKYFQGYYISRPLSNVQLIEFIKQNKKCSYSENQMSVL